MSTFQERLKYYRKLAGYKTAKEFSEAICIPYSRYLNYENKGQEPKYETLIKIADKLNRSTDELLGHVTPTVYTSHIPKEIALAISRSAEEVKNHYVNECLEMYAEYNKKRGLSENSENIVY